MKRLASAVWMGDVETGKGHLTTPSGALKESPYSFKGRFEDAGGTNPEELVAAAHAGCFTMALASFLGKAGFTAQRLETKANLQFDKVQGNWTIVAIHFDLNAHV